MVSLLGRLERQDFLREADGELLAFHLVALDPAGVVVLLLPLVKIYPPHFLRLAEPHP